MKIHISARKSDLARLQAYTVGRALQKSQDARLEVSYHFSASLGDINLTDPLWKIPEKGVFTKDLTEKLLRGETDLVVHSWKDVPTEPSEQTQIVATLERADTRDLVLVRKDTWSKVLETKKLHVFSSSPRRTHHLAPFLKWALPGGLREVSFESVRGNIPTRLEKLMNGEADALVVAKAALDRLLTAEEDEFQDVKVHIRKLVEQCRWVAVPLSQCPGAPAQGALAIEIRKDRKDLASILKGINSETTFRNVEAERAILNEHGGGCHQKIGVTKLSRPFGDVLYVLGETDKGQRLEERRLLRPRYFSKVPGDQIFPYAMSGAKVFDRKEIDADMTPVVAEKHFLFVAKSEALPEGTPIFDESVVWVSGNRTWRQLAERGVWVNGSTDGLGEQEPPMTEILAGVLNKIKLSHDGAPTDDGTQLIATYKIVDGEVPDLQGKTDFFWPSFSTYQQVARKYPDVGLKRHYCGPGNTYTLLRKELGPDAKIEICLSYNEWRDLILEENV